MRKNILKNLQVEEISMVRRTATPANEGAMVLLTKVAQEEETMPFDDDTELTIQELAESVMEMEKVLKNSSGKVRKSAIPSKIEAQEFIEMVADAIQEFEPALSREQSVYKALLRVPIHGGLAMGKSLEMARGSY